MADSPTIETYPELQRAFAYFNKHLFESKLSAPLFTLESHVRYHGYFSKNKFTSSDGKRTTHQIAMNPASFHERSVKENLSTMVHEMCHQFQTEHGSESRRSYHDKQWASYMEECGLIPSDTGLPNGKKTGQKMTHYIQKGGRFDLLADALIKDGFDFAWHDPYTIARYRQASSAKTLKVRSNPSTPTSVTMGANMATPRSTTHMVPSSVQTHHPEANEAYNSSNRVKFICITCSQQCWGKRGLKILCGTQGCDNRPFEAEADY